MATKCFLWSGAATYNKGGQAADLSGTNRGWVSLPASGTQGTSATSATRTITSGPTSGEEVPINYEWISYPLSADVTISGTITFNLRMAENAMTANAGAQCVIERIDNLGATISTIVNSERGTEMGTAQAAQNWTASPTSTDMKKGDRFRIRVAVNDAGGTLTGGGGQFATLWWGGTAGASGDTYVQFNETFTFLFDNDPDFGRPELTGSQYFLRDTTGPAVGANIEKLMSTSRGASATSVVTSVPNGFVSPVQLTNSAGGTAVEWYTPQLNAFTLADAVQCRSWAKTGGSISCGVMAEIAVCDNDGTNVTVFGFNGDDNSGTLSTTDNVLSHWIFGPDISVATGQRLRYRLYIDDTSSAMNASGTPATFYYDGPTASAQGDCWITLEQTVTEYTPGGGTEDPYPYVGAGYYPTEG